MLSATQDLSHRRLVQPLFELATALLCCYGAASAQTLRVNTFPYDAMSENRYHVQVNGQSLPVFRAGMNVYLVSFEEPAHVVDWSNDPTATYDNFVFRNITLLTRPDAEYFMTPHAGVNFEQIHMVP